MEEDKSPGKEGRVVTPTAAPIGIHLRITKNAKLPPICAFLIAYNNLPKLRKCGGRSIVRLSQFFLSGGTIQSRIQKFM
jgi:hypothetical protein